MMPCRMQQSSRRSDDDWGTEVARDPATARGSCARSCCRLRPACGGRPRRHHSFKMMLPPGGLPTLDELSGQVFGEACDVLRAEERVDVLDVRRVLQAADRIDRVEAVRAEPAFEPLAHGRHVPRPM